jgi:hypothetical protein
MPGGMLRECALQNFGRRPQPAPLRAGLGMFDDPIVARPPTNPDPALFNEDFSPTTTDKRTFDTTDFATFWITLVISITTYYLAASLVDLGAWYRLSVLAPGSTGNCALGAG